MTKKHEVYIEKYDLERLPVEGIYVKKIYESELTIESRSVCSMMLGLHAKDLGSKSYLHKLSSDEVWIYLEGDPLELILLDEKGELNKVVLGPDLDMGQLRTYTIKAGIWQAGQSLGEYTIFSCTVVLGFVNSCFEGADSEILERYPKHKDILTKYIPTEKYLPDDYKG